MLLIIDNQSRFIKLFTRHYLAEQDFDYRIFDHNQPISLPDKPKVKGIILSGGKGNPYEPLNLTSNFVALINFNVPIMGFCLGHEVIAAAYGGRIKKLPEYHGKKEMIKITEPADPIFDGIEKTEVLLVKSHSFYVSKLPSCFNILATSGTCETEIIKHKTKTLYGIQSHPEVSGEEGMLMVRNFLKICRLL